MSPTTSDEWRSAAPHLPPLKCCPRRQPAANLPTQQRDSNATGSARGVRARGGLQEVTKDDMEIVSAMHRALAGKVGQERFAVWFGRGVRVEPCGETLSIRADDT